MLHYSRDGVQIHLGDCLEVMKALEPNSIDAIVSDPPYGIRFMGKSWDGKDIAAMTKDRAKYSQDPDPRAGERGGHRSRASQAGKYDRSKSANQMFQSWSQYWAVEALRIARPGAHLIAFGGPRTYHRLTCAVEDAGWDIRDCMMWVFGSGFPKSHNLKGEWNGWGTALKPAYEPILVARKPLQGTVAQNVLKWGTGAMNIDGCRINAEPWNRSTLTKHDIRGGRMHAGTADTVVEVGPQNGSALGRWPANLIHDGSDEVLAVFPNAPGQIADAKTKGDRKFGNCYSPMKYGRAGERSAESDNAGEVGFKMKPGARRLDTGSAARFFYSAKASASDRGHEEWDALPLFNESAGSFKNTHPTVKPLALMRYLLTLISRDGSVILDPFMGSGSTLLAGKQLGRKMIGIDSDTICADIAVRRLNGVAQYP